MEVVKIKKQQRIRFERIQSIFTMRRQKKTIREIAKICACSPSTVSATLTKYSHPDPRTWRGMNQYEKAKYVWDQQKATARSKRRYRGHIADAWTRNYVEEKLTIEGWSPEIISSKLKIEQGKSLSTNTIYRYVKKNRARLTKCLWYKGKPRKQRIAHRRGTLRKHERAEKKRITERPAIINKRIEFGHWEGDLVLGPKAGSGYVLLSLIERKSRKKAFVRMPNAEAGTTLAYLRAFFLKLPPEARKSITLDNGSEFSIFYMRKLQDDFKDSNFQVYYTETYAPQQKGSDEHSNGRLRRAYPKKTDFAFVPIPQLNAEVLKLNLRPMKLHGFESPEEVFNECLLATETQLKQAA